MNNIRGTNVVILKQLISNKTKNNFNNQLIYFITTTTQSQKLTTF